MAQHTQQPSPASLVTFNGQLVLAGNIPVATAAVVLIATNLTLLLWGSDLALHGKPYQRTYLG